MRDSTIKRITNETNIECKLNLDGSGIYEINSGIGFLNHMLELFTKHSGVDLALTCTGDTHIDFHHSVEDIGIVLGKSFEKALADKRGIMRYSHTILPMDEALVLCAVDIGGRSFLDIDINLQTPKIGNFDTQLVDEFFWGFTRNSNICIHIKQISGKNSHHIVEAVFKAFAICMKNAIKINADNSDEIPSTKGKI